MVLVVAALYRIPFQGDCLSGLGKIIKGLRSLRCTTTTKHWIWSYKRFSIHNPRDTQQNPKLLKYLSTMCHAACYQIQIQGLSLRWQPVQDAWILLKPWCWSLYQNCGVVNAPGMNGCLKDCDCSAGLWNKAGHWVKWWPERGSGNNWKSFLGFNFPQKIGQK